MEAGASFTFGWLNLEPTAYLLKLSTRQHQVIVREPDVSPGLNHPCVAPPLLPCLLMEEVHSTAGIVLLFTHPTCSLVF